MKKRRIDLFILIIIYGLIASLAITVNNPYFLHMLFMLTIYSILTCSLQIAVGITGLSNLSHATFFGIGAYAAAITASKLGFPFYLTVLTAGLISLFFGLILGAPTLRLKGFYLALVTIGFGQIVRTVELNWISLTNGPMGIPGIPNAQLLSYSFSKRDFILYGLMLVAITQYITDRMLKAKLGRALGAIKSDEIVAKSLGVDVTKYKLIAFSISALFAGMAGSIYAHYISYVSPDSFTASDSITILCMVILGGSGTLYGPLLGTAILILSPEVLRFADLYRLIFVGVVMVITVISKENDWSGKLVTWIKKLKFREAQSEVK